jgi:Mrp family chromosome partitioning ATPase
MRPGPDAWPHRGAPRPHSSERVSPFRGFVVVSGPPASGKSTLAPALATALDLPLQ